MSEASETGILGEIPAHGGIEAIVERKMGWPVRIPHVDVSNLSGRNLGAYSAAFPTLGDAIKLAMAIQRLGCPARIDKFHEDMHVTVMYSKVAGIDPRLVAVPSEPIFAVVRGVTVWGGHASRCMVILLESEALQSLHAMLRRAGGVHSYPSLNAHMTIKCGIEDRDAEEYRKWAAMASTAMRGMTVKFDRVLVEDLKP